MTSARHGFPSLFAHQMREARHVAEMIDALPAVIHDEALPLLVRSACLQCFFA